AGRIAVLYEDAKKSGVSVDDFVRQQVADLIGVDTKLVSQPQDIVLFGFGRIGRLMARLLIEKAGGGDSLRLRAIVVRKGKADDDLMKRASLLQRDSVHGPFNGTIRVDEERQSLVCNGNEVKIIYGDTPDAIDYTAYGITNAIVVDNTGKWSDRDGLAKHLKCPGVAKVILTAPGKGDLKNIVFGINDDQILPEDTIIT